MNGNKLHQNQFPRASQRWDVPITVSRRSFIRFNFWIDQELANLEARSARSPSTGKSRIDKQRFSSTDPLA